MEFSDEDPLGFLAGYPDRAVKGHSPFTNKMDGLFLDLLSIKQ